MRPDTIEARFLGYWIGDGTVSYAKGAALKISVQLYGAGEDDWKTVEPFILRRNWPQNVFQRKGCWGLHVPAEYHKRLIEAFGSLPFVEKHLPLGWRSWRDRERKALLEGLIQADGTISDGTPVIYTAVESLARELEELVEGLGFQSHTSECMRNRVQYAIRLRKTDRVKTLKLVGAKASALGGYH